MNCRDRRRGNQPGRLVKTTLMRHARIAGTVWSPSQSPPSGPCRMGTAPPIGLLVAASCRTLGLSSAGGRTNLAAEALAAIALTAQQNLQAAASTHQHPRGTLRARGAFTIERHCGQCAHAALHQALRICKAAMNASKSSPPDGSGARRRKLCLAREPERMHVVGCVKGSLRRAAPALDAANHVKCSPIPKPPPRQRIDADPDQRSHRPVMRRTSLRRYDRYASETVSSGRCREGPVTLQSGCAYAL